MSATTCLESHPDARSGEVNRGNTGEVQNDDPGNERKGDGCEMCFVGQQKKLNSTAFQPFSKRNGTK